MIQDARTHRDADCDSDHYLVNVKTKVKIKSIISIEECTIREPAINTDSLKYENILQKINLELKNRIIEHSRD